MSHPGDPSGATTPDLSQQTATPVLQQAAPPAPKQDSTRTIAIVALVVAGLAIVGQLATMVLPMLFFGVFGLFGFSGDFGEEFGPSGVVTIGGGQVKLAADRTVTGPELTRAVRDLIGPDDPFLPPIENITCEPAPPVGADVSVLCRAGAGEGWVIVRFIDEPGEFEAVVVPGDEMMMP